MEIIDKKMHNFATKIGSKAGVIFKLLKEKGTVIHERIEESPSQINKLEEIFSNLSTAFASAKTIENPRKDWKSYSSYQEQGRNF